MLLLEQTFSINLKSLITPSFIKGSGVIFFFSSKLIDSNICQDHALQQTHGKILYLYTQPPVKKKTIQKRVLNQHARTRTLCVCFLFFFLTDTQSKCFVSETLILLQSNIHSSGNRKKTILKTLFLLFWYLH